MENYIDALTGLPNRKALEIDLDKWIETEDSVSLALLDVDHFMEINNAHGLEKGDEVLCTLTEMLRETAADHAYRVSGDEFAVVMPGTSLEQAFLKMEALRSRVDRSQNRFDVAEKNEVTITVGVAHYPRDAKDGQALNRSANAALMTAKEAGRNQVALPPNEEMIMKTCYYPSTGIRRLKSLAECMNKTESFLLREALNDLLRKYDQVLK